MTKFIPIGTDQYQIPTEDPSVEEAVEVRLRVAALYRLIARLPLDEQEIIRTVLAEETTMAARAARLGLTTSQAHHRNARAVKSLHALAQKHESRYLYSEAA